MPNLGRPIEILLIEDSPGDVRLTIEALKQAKVTNNLHVCIDGELGMQFLRREVPYEDVPTPDLILLDLNLPRLDGREVLAQVKSDPVLCKIPIVILTTSRADEDIARSYELHANCYISKPVDFNNFMEVVRNIEQFWLTLVELPRQD